MLPWNLIRAVDFRSDAPSSFLPSRNRGRRRRQDPTAEPTPEHTGVVGILPLVYHSPNRKVLRAEEIVVNSTEGFLPVIEQL
jgi:hypothetical protein